MKDYIVYSDDDPSIPEEFYTRKRDAIRAAKEMAQESGEDAMVLPCIDGYANDFAPPARTQWYFHVLTAMQTISHHTT